MSKTFLPGLGIKDEGTFSLTYLMEEAMESRIVMSERAETEYLVLSPIDGEISRCNFVTEMIRLKDYSLRLTCK